MSSNPTNVLRIEYEKLNRKQKTYFRMRMQAECGWNSEITFKRRLKGEIELTRQDMRTVQMVVKEISNQL